MLLATIVKLARRLPSTVPCPKPDPELTTAKLRLARLEQVARVSHGPPPKNQDHPVDST